MPDEPIVTPAVGQVADPDPVEPAIADNLAQPSGVIPEKFLVDGRPDPEKIWESYRNVEQEKGRLGSEIGELRKFKDEATGWYQQNIHIVDDNGQERIMLRSDYDRQEAERKAAEGPSEAEIAEQLRELQEENPVKYHELMIEAATQKAVELLDRRNQAFTDPYVSQNPDVAARARELVNQGQDPSLAISIAAGEKARGVLRGNNPNNGLPIQPRTFQPPSRSSFISPVGTPAPETPKSGVTPEQLEAARRILPGGNMMSDAEIEAKLAPHIDNDRTR